MAQSDGIGVLIQYVGRESGSKMLKTLKQHGISALFALPTDFLKGSSMVAMVQEIRKGHHSVGFAFVPPKGKSTKNLNDSSITAELRTAKGRFKELYNVALRYITFPHTEDLKEHGRLTKLAEAEGLINVGHSLYLGAGVDEAKKSLLENVYQADSSTYIALIEGFGEDPSAVITELANRANEKYFKISAFGRCVGMAERRIKHAKGPTFALTSLKCVGRVQSNVSAKKGSKSKATAKKDSSKKQSSKKGASKSKQAAAPPAVKPGVRVNPAFIRSNAKSLTPAVVAAATKQKKRAKTSNEKPRAVVNPAFIQGFRATPKKGADGVTTKKRGGDHKRTSTKMAAKRAKSTAESEGGSKEHWVKLHKRNKPVVPKKDTIMAAQKAAETGAPCKDGKDCDKTGVAAKSTKEDKGAASSVTVSLAALLVSIAAGVALLI